MPAAIATAKERCKFVVEVDRIPNVEVREIAEFIADSLEWAGGCRRPDDPFFGSLKVYSVSSYRRVRRGFWPRKKPATK